MSRVLAITGTSTDVGKTVATAAVAAVASGRGVTTAVCKPVQTGLATGEPGDLAEINRLAGESITTLECARYPEPLAPETAALRGGSAFVERSAITTAISDLRDRHDLTLVEGAGGILVRLAAELTLLDIAADVDAAVLVVVHPGLGALNHAELTVDAIRRRGLRVSGLILGSWPVRPDLAMRCNREDLPRLTGVPIVATIPAGVGRLGGTDLRRRAASWFDPRWLDAELTPAAPDHSQTVPENQGAFS